MWDGKVSKVRLQGLRSLEVIKMLCKKFTLDFPNHLEVVQLK